MVTLRNVIDIRTGNRHSIAVVQAKNVRWYVPAE